jgi:hypothetical protein
LKCTDVVEEVPQFIVGDKNGFTVTVLVAVTLAQPPVPRTVYVMVAVPEATPVTSPEAAFIVAIVVSEELQVPPKVVEENVEVRPMQIF